MDSNRELLIYGGPEWQEQANKEAWERLKERFRNCPNPEQWTIDEATRTIYSIDGILV